MTSSGDSPVDPVELDIGPRAVIATRYEILSPLGAGGMGWVFKARDRILGETVALKVLRSDLGLDAERTERFRSEIRFARRVRHKNVCGLHEYGEDGNLHYIAMEYVEGSDLKQVVEERGPLPWDEAYAAAIQCAEGLAAIHEMGIIHRDIKTANITRDRAGIIRLMDFGIAMEWWGSGGAGVPGANPVVGTPEYMSPEQVRGQALDFRSDLYSLGVVVYELFAGQVPFRGETPLATMLKHFADEPSFTGAEGDAIPAPLVPLLRRALAKQPEGRPDSAREMADALRQAQLASGPEPALRAPNVPRPRRRGPTTQTLDAPPSREAAPAPLPAPERPHLATPADRPSLSSLLSALTHADRDVRAGAAHGLGRFGPAAVGAVGALVRSLKDPSSAVRAGAAHALRKIGPPAMGAVVPLIDAMKDEHGYVRDAAAWAVAELTALPLPPGRLPGSFLRVPTASPGATLGVTLSPHQDATTETPSPSSSEPRLDTRALPPRVSTGWRYESRGRVLVGTLAFLALGLIVLGRSRQRSVEVPPPAVATGPTAVNRPPASPEPRRRTGAERKPPGVGASTTADGVPADSDESAAAPRDEGGPSPNTTGGSIPYGALVSLSAPGVSAPVPTLAPRPRHPDAGHRPERSATVEVRILVDEEGRVAGVEWVSGPPEWQTSIGSDLRNWTYRPASLQGVPVKVYLSLSFGFGASDS